MPKISDLPLANSVDSDDLLIVEKDGTTSRITFNDFLGGGTVTGPASATDNTIPRFNGTTGGVLQGSGISVDDSDNLITSGSITAANLSGINTGDQNAAGVSYTNITSGLTATNVQTAIDELDSTLDGLGTLSTQNTINNGDWLGDDLDIANGGTGASTPSAARDNLGLTIGTDVQAHSTILDNTTASFTTALETKLSGIEAGADVTDTDNVTSSGALMDSEVVSLSGIKTLVVPDNTNISAFGASLVANTTNTAARTTLGLGSLATLSTINNVNWSGTDLSVANGGTGVSTLTGIVKGNGASAFTAAVQGVDYYAPAGTDVAVSDGGTGSSTAAGARTNLDVYSKAETDTIAKVQLQTPVATTSGASIVIPVANTDKNVIFINFDKVSLSGTNNLWIRPNQQTTGYTAGAGLIGTSAAAGTTSTTAFVINQALASNLMSGVLILSRVTGNTWSISGGVSVAGGNNGVLMSYGSVDLSAALTEIEFLSSGGNTFDNGQISIGAI